MEERPISANNILTATKRATAENFKKLKLKTLRYFTFLKRLFLLQLFCPTQRDEKFNMNPNVVINYKTP